MLKKIILHETLLNLTSFRFHLIVGLFAVMFFGGLAVNIDNYKTRLKDYTEAAAVESHYSLAVPPNPLNAFAEGTDRYSAMSAATDRYLWDFTVKRLGTNNVVAPRLSAFETLDFSFAVKVLLSLGAILITFSSVSGERFSGTLKLASASGASKKHLILGKLSASFICLALPLLICTIISCVVLALNGMITFQIDIVRVGLFVLFSLIYILFFLLVGLIISISTRRPQESLVMGVLCWLVFVFVVPALIPQASKLFVDLPSARAMEEAKMLSWTGEFFEMSNSSGYTKENSDAAINRIRDQSDAEREKSRNQFANYAAINRWFALISPSDLFGNASMEIVGNGVQNALHTKRSIFQHKDNLRKDPRNAAFAFKRAGFATDLLAALFSMFVLCVEIIALLVVAYRKFMLLDLREG
jgi:ABC-type transport system involved in multi-copper enzyme maturation permease subunit